MNSFDLYVYHPKMDMVISFIAQYALEIYGVMFLVAWLILPKEDLERRHALVIMAHSQVIMFQEALDLYIFSRIGCVVFNFILNLAK